MSNWKIDTDVAGPREPLIKVEQANPFGHLGPNTRITGHDLIVDSAHDGENTSGMGVVHLDGKPHNVKFGANPMAAQFILNGHELSEDHPLHQQLADHVAMHWPDSNNGNFRKKRMKL